MVMGIGDLIRSYLTLITKNMRSRVETREKVYNFEKSKHRIITDSGLKLLETIT